MSPHTLRKAGLTPTPTGSGVTFSALPADLLREASKRLGWAGLVYSGTFLFASVVPHIITAILLQEHALTDRMFQLIVSLISIVLGIAVFAMSRHARIRPDLLLDIGLIFEVVGAFGISMAQFWGIFPEWEGQAYREYVGIPWECVWIVMFPLIAPNTPGKTLLASLGAASTGLLTVMLSMSVGATDPATPMSVFLVYFAFTTYLCAAIAFFISKAVYRFGSRLHRAQEVGSYQLVRPLGEGGMGEVWLARHCMLARPAAIKLIRGEALGPDEPGRKNACHRFEREARATAALGSCHTITIYDFGVTADGSFYYVMELLRGLSLDALVRRFGPVKPNRVVHFLRQACHSLAEAHDRGLIHRDVKPGNIFTCRLGREHDFVKVLDFGLVKARGAAQFGATELTAEGIAAGTPAFMAPEMALGKSEVDGRADIYGLGCVGYWLLTGERVFEEDTPLATVVAHVQEKPKPPSLRTEVEIPEALERVIMACLEKDPADRPDSAMELDAMLAAVAPEERWTADHAREWWMLHLSQLESDDDVGETVDSPELLRVER
jgi:serine/threonine-protein kinase